ncbi:hypothetical protein [Herbaspirillum sp. SJZ107]|uniref:hypothetical protein n=1 Tax=Herbaspirillum sp. SJZ107 TaxID=2572881 RepID=UPI00351A3C79
MFRILPASHFCRAACTFRQTAASSRSQPANSPGNACEPINFKRIAASPSVRSTCVSSEILSV